MYLSFCKLELIFPFCIQRFGGLIIKVNNMSLYNCFLFAQCKRTKLLTLVKFWYLSRKQARFFCSFRPDKTKNVYFKGATKTRKHLHSKKQLNWQLRNQNKKMLSQLLLRKIFISVPFRPMYEEIRRCTETYKIFGELIQP